MKKVCKNKDCELAGLKQPPENFYNGRRFCKACTKKIDGDKMKIKYQEQKEFLKMFAV